MTIRWSYGQLNLKSGSIFVCFEIKFWWERQKRECMEDAKIGPDLSL